MCSTLNAEKYSILRLHHSVLLIGLMVLDRLSFIIFIIPGGSSGNRICYTPTMEKRLYRSQKDKVIAGVCGGIAVHLNVDPVLVRLVYILLTFGTGLGPGLIVYFIAWIIIPLETTEVVITASTESAPIES